MGLICEKEEDSTLGLFFGHEGRILLALLSWVNRGFYRYFGWLVWLRPESEDSRV